MGNTIKAINEILNDKLALIESLTKEKASLEAALDESKARLVQNCEAMAAEIKKRDEKIAELEKVSTSAQEELATLKADAEALKAKLSLTPIASVEGAEKVPVTVEAAAPAPVVSHRKVVEGLRGTERMAYYKAHRAEIDAEYK
jgi:septal ring factor EnvC (AmiA/AmiB activator)